MGRRARRRAEDAAPEGGLSTRAERDAARARRRAGGETRPARRRRPGERERPEAPWGSFPLSELVVLVALVLGVAGLIVWGRQGQTMLVAAAALGSLAGLELSLREHFGGFRSHSTLLAGVGATLAMVAAFFIAGRGPAGAVAVLITGGVVFALVFFALREAFRRRSGGLSFR